jgi:hypothetical protein
MYGVLCSNVGLASGNHSPRSIRLLQITEMNPPPKSIFKSKTSFANAILALVGALGTISPEANKFIATHASTILLIAGGANIGLRFVTNGRVVLFANTD